MYAFKFRTRLGRSGPTRRYGSSKNYLTRSFPLLARVHLSNVAKRSNYGILLRWGTLVFGRTRSVEKRYHRSSLSTRRNPSAYSFRPVGRTSPFTLTRRFAAWRRKAQTKVRIRYCNSRKSFGSTTRWSALVSHTTWQYATVYRYYTRRAKRWQ